MEMLGPKSLPLPEEEKKWREALRMLLVAYNSHGSLDASKGRAVGPPSYPTS